MGFDEHIKSLKFDQGEHVFISGATKCGKTTLAREVLEKRSHVITFCVKIHDDTIKKEYKDWSIVGNLSEIEGWMNRVVLWPRMKHAKTASILRAHQKEVVKDAFDKLYVSRGWCLFVDELNYLCKYFGVQEIIESMHYTSRSSNTSIVTAAQRPAYVPLAVLTNNSHVYLANTRLQTDLKRLSDLGGIDTNRATATLKGLESRHDFLYIPTQGNGIPAVLNTRRR
jgi:hypothetical protein